MSAVQSSTASYVHLFLFSFLVTDFNPAWFGHYGCFLEDEGLSAKRARSIICGVHLLAGAVKEDYGAGPKMVHVTGDTSC
jgi:hypothetical protein